MRHDSHAFAKSVLSLLLSFAMVFDTVPTTALAAAMPTGDDATSVASGEGASPSDDVSYTESDEGLRAFVVDGSAELSDKALTRRLVDEGLDKDDADDVVYELKVARVPRRDGGDEDLPRSGDGSL